MSVDLVRIVDSIHRDKNIPKDILFDGIQSALTTAAGSIIRMRPISRFTLTAIPAPSMQPRMGSRWTPPSSGGSRLRPPSR